jgi:hypothetical protein
MFSAARVAAIVGTTLVTGGAALPEAALPAEPPHVIRSEAHAPAFVFGAGDALGIQIRIHDEILARRSGRDGVRHAGAGTDR